jgi:hypothetical protein
MKIAKSNAYNIIFTDKNGSFYIVYARFSIILINFAVAF